MNKFRIIIWKGILISHPVIFTVEFEGNREDLEDRISNVTSEHNLISFHDIKKNIRFFNVCDIRRIIIKEL